MVIIAILTVFSPVSGREAVQMEPIKITSPAFQDNGSIPRQYTCDGKDINPPLVFVNVPKEAKSLALIVDDPDAPVGTWVHWVLWNIDPNLIEIRENSVPAGATQGKNDFRKNIYGGPCPPSGTHRYFFKVYALDTILNIKPYSTKADLENAMMGHILSDGKLVGKYKR